MSDPTQLRAACLAAALAAGLVCWLFRGYRRVGYPPVKFVFHLINQAFTRVLWRAQVRGAWTLPPRQGALVVCNHRSSIDPLLLQLGTLRIMHWMVAREFVTFPGLAWVFRVVPHIPVGRGGVDTAATKQAIRLAERGGLVGLFPEGRINETDRVLLPGRPGAALIALRARVPVVPCFIQGAPYGGHFARPLFTPARVTITLGPPLDLSEFYDRDGDRAALEEATRRILQAIARLAGHESYEVQVVGRRGDPSLAGPDGATGNASAPTPPPQAAASRRNRPAT
jgi:1-acyl-sn-glycerol-3-phosphate acyltransferase